MTVATGDRRLQMRSPTISREIHELMGTHKLMGFCKLMGFHKLMEIHKLVYFHKRKNFSLKYAKKLHILGLTLYNASINGFTAT
jgi:hypothetical protein